jgi:hypothetical protein
MERLSSFGIYWVIVNGLVDEQLRKEFQDVWGELIQEYVRDLLERCIECSVGTFLRRPTYGDRKTEVFDSAIIIAESLVAIEIKGSVLAARHRYAAAGGAFFQGLSAKFGGGQGAAVEQLLRNISNVFRWQNPQRTPSIPRAQIREIFPVAIVHDPVLRSGFAAHALANEFREDLSELKLRADVQVRPLQVLAVEDLERLEPYIADREFTVIDCLRAKAYEDPNHRWAFWDFVMMHYLPSRGIAQRTNIRLDAVLEWLIESALWRIYRGDYRDSSLGKISPSDRACICIRPLDGEDVLFDEWKVLSEHPTAAEAYNAVDELMERGMPEGRLEAKHFDIAVADPVRVCGAPPRNTTPLDMGRLTPKS